MTYDAPPPFVSAYGFQDLIGTRKTAFEDGFCRLELDLAPCHMNRALIPHGGVYACLLDTALGAAGVYAGTPNDFHPAVTLKLNISYLASPDDGRRVAEGRRRAHDLFLGRPGRGWPRPCRGARQRHVPAAAQTGGWPGVNCSAGSIRGCNRRASAADRAA